MALLVLLLPSAGKAATWTTDYAAAVMSAKQQDRAVFVFFTGSDWCGWCMKLDREILTTSEFQAFADANLILVKLDFPHNKTLPADEAARNKELATQFGVTGFPTVFVLDRNGQNAGRLGYMEGGPAAFIPAMRQFPGITWRTAAPATPAGAVAPVKAAVAGAPVPLFNGAPLRAPKRFDRLQLNGIMGTAQRRMVMVNNQTLMTGDSARLEISDRKVKVTCKEIRPKSVVLIVEGNPVPQEIFLDGN